MNCAELHALIPEQTERSLGRALEHARVRAAVDDLDVALNHIERCREGSPSRKDWEATRDELLDEIRRLAQRLNDGR
jgi:Mn-dependent DtxR family transcriptional regulator